MFTIRITNSGNHFCNPLLGLRGQEYATRVEACEAIYAALYDVIDGENGCEMIERPDPNIDDDEEYNRVMSDYVERCHQYIMREGHATEDGVTATVEEKACEVADGWTGEAAEHYFNVTD